MFLLFFNAHVIQVKETSGTSGAKAIFSDECGNQKLLVLGLKLSTIRFVYQDQNKFITTLRIVITVNNVLITNISQCIHITNDALLYSSSYAQSLNNIYAPLYCHFTVNFHWQ